MGLEKMPDRFKWQQMAEKHSSYYVILYLQHRIQLHACRCAHVCKPFPPHAAVDILEYLICSQDSAITDCYLN